MCRAEIVRITGETQNEEEKMDKESDGGCNGCHGAAFAVMAWKLGIPMYLVSGETEAQMAGKYKKIVAIRDINNG